MMDEDDINGLIQRCQKLKHKFRGVFAADNFPSKLKSNTFLIVNASKSQSPGTHWLLICKKNDHLLFADPLGRSLSSYKNIYQLRISRGRTRSLTILQVSLMSTFYLVQTFRHHNPKQIQPMSRHPIAQKLQ